MYKVIFHEGRYLISLADVQSKANISKNTVKDWVRRGVVCKIYFNDEYYIPHSEIPKPTQLKYFPIAAIKQMCKGSEHDAFVNYILEKLQIAYHYGWQKLREYYASKYSLSADKITLFARLHAAWETLGELRGSGMWSNAAAHESFSKLFPHRINTLKSFNKVFAESRRLGLEYVTVDTRLFKEKGFTYCDKVDFYIRRYLSHPKRYTLKRVHELAMEACKAEGISRLPKLSCAKKHMNRLLDNIEIYQSRNGAMEASKQMPTAKIIGAKYPLSQVQIDGITLPFYYRENGKLKKLILVVLLDNHSEKILGYSFGVSENSEVIFNALEATFRKTEMLPAEIVSDNHTFHKTAEATHFKDILNSFGVLWTVDSNPRRKARLERKFKLLTNQFFIEIPGSVGEGVLTKNKSGRASQEYIDHYLKPENIHTPDTIKVHVIDAIKKYNAAPLKKYNKSPNELYDQGEKKHGISLDIYDRVKLFTKANKLKVSRGQINITRSGVLYEFQLTAEQMHELNNKEVLVRYENLNDGIYLYSTDKDLPLGEVKPKEGIRGAIVEQDDTDKLAYLKNSGRIKGFKAKARKENEHRSHKDAVHDVNPLKNTKDVMQKLQEDSDFKNEVEEHGVNPYRYTQPIWDDNKFTPISLIPKEKKENKSPFAVRGEHKISLMTDDDFNEE